MRKLSIISLSLILFVLCTNTQAFSQLITFDDQGYTNGQNLGNPYTSVNNGETFKFSVSNGGAPIATNHIYRTTESWCGNTGLGMLDFGTTSATTWTIETQSGAEFNLGTVQFVNIFTCSPSFNYELSIEGFENGGSTWTQAHSADGLASIWIPNASFDNVDKIMITCTNMVNFGVDNINWIAFSSCMYRPIYNIL